MALVLRLSNNGPLTAAQLDGNFTFLQTLANGAVSNQFNAYNTLATFRAGALKTGSGIAYIFGSALTGGIGGGGIYRYVTGDTTSADNGYTILVANDGGRWYLTTPEESMFPSSTQPQLTTYTPVWTSAGTQPAIGNGTIKGTYWYRGKEVHLNVAIAFGSTTTFGTGAYSFSLPSAVAFTGTSANVDSTTGFYGTAAFTCASNWVVGATSCGPGATTFAIIAPGTTGNISATFPATFANGNGINASLVYMAA